MIPARRLRRCRRTTGSAPMEGSRRRLWVGVEARVRGEEGGRRRMARRLMDRMGGRGENESYMYCVLVYGVEGEGGGRLFVLKELAQKWEGGWIDKIPRVRHTYLSIGISFFHIFYYLTPVLHGT